jgi:hypothetical protein
VQPLTGSSLITATVVKLDIFRDYDT